MEAGHDAPILSVEQDLGTAPTMPAAAAAAAAVASPPVLPLPPSSAAPPSAGSGADEEDWQMVTPGGSPRSPAGSAHSSLTSEEGHADEGHSDEGHVEVTHSDERHSECSETGAQAELNSLELADSILGSRAESASDGPGLPQPPRLRTGARSGAADDDGPSPPAATAAPAGAFDGSDDGCADAPATPTASAGSGEPAARAFGLAGAALAPRGVATRSSCEIQAAPAATAAAAREGSATASQAEADGLLAGLAACGARAGVAMEAQLVAISHWVLESVTMLARGARDGGGAVHEAMCAAMSRLALMLPRTGKAGSGADGVDWWTVLLGGGFAVSTAAAVYCFCSYWRVRGELQRRDRELAKLVVRIMSLQEVLSTYRRLPVARYTHHTTTTTTHAAVTGFAHSMAYL